MLSERAYNETAEDTETIVSLLNIANKQDKCSVHTTGVPAVYKADVLASPPAADTEMLNKEG